MLEETCSGGCWGGCWGGPTAARVLPAVGAGGRAGRRDGCVPPRPPGAPASGSGSRAPAMTAAPSRRCPACPRTTPTTRSPRHHPRRRVRLLAGAAAGAGAAAAAPPHGAHPRQRPEPVQRVQVGALLGPWQPWCCLRPGGCEWSAALLAHPRLQPARACAARRAARRACTRRPPPPPPSPLRRRPRERIHRPQTRRRRENNQDSLEKLRMIRENVLKVRSVRSAGWWERQRLAGSTGWWERGGWRGRLVGGSAEVGRVTRDAPEGARDPGGRAQGG